MKKLLRIENTTRQTVLATHCEVADNLFTRIRGLLGRDGLEAGGGLLIAPCPSIHMWGMKFALDAVFVDEEDVVVDLAESLAPGKYFVARPHESDGSTRKARNVYELPVGTIATSQTQRGDVLIRHSAHDDPA
jgi:uncharacterized membrane protein (UPF0127 family)